MSLKLCVIVLLLTAAANCIRVSLIVSPNAGAEDHCGTEDRPCTLQAAIAMAPSHTTLHLRHGVYTGFHRITTPISIVGERFTDHLTVFDGGGVGRPLTFDNVVAHVDGVTFVNGVGEGAGCVLVSLSSNRIDAANNFTRCSFINCTGYATSPTTIIAAGAVGVTYEHTIGSSYEMNKVHFSSNFGRSKFIAAGAAVVQYSPPTGMSSKKPCNTFALHLTHESVAHLAGVYQKLRGVTQGGYPVYKSSRLGNIMIKNSQLTPLFVAYCYEKMAWSIFSGAPGKASSEILASNSACNSPMATTSTRFAAEIFESGLSTVKWVLNTGQVAQEPFRFVCQDTMKICPVIEVVNAKDSQAHRNGVYYKTNTTRGGRPTFTKVVDGEKQQYVWYCPGAREWIVSDDDPEFATDSQKICSRGIATLETFAMHPMLVPTWRFWDLDTWRTSSSSANGIHVTCRPNAKDMCSAIEIVNYVPTDAMSGPHLLTNFTWNSRPTYKLKLGEIYIWYCGVFSEWVVSETNPTKLIRNEETCSRALSSHPTQAFSPTLSTVKWAQFVLEEWRTLKAPMAIRCVDGCSRLIVSEFPREFIGIYESITIFNGSRIFVRKRSADMFLFFDDKIQCWRLTRDPSSEAATEYTGCGGGKMAKTNIYLVKDWLKNNTVLSTQPHFACDIHSHCNRLNFTLLPGGRYQYLLGVWEPGKGVIADRPFFTRNHLGTEVHLMYYCASYQKWVIGPEFQEGQPSRCPAWLASRVTAATHPLVDVEWALIGDGQKWEALAAPLQMMCAVDPTEPDEILQPTSLMFSASKRSPSPAVTDSFTDCNFTGNIGVSHTVAGAAGAVMMHFGRAGISPDPTGAFRKVLATNNEAASTQAVGRDTQSAGAILIRNDYEHRTVHAQVIDSVVTENRGEAGGIVLDAVKATLHKLQLTRNVAFSSGGGLLLRHRSNVSASYSSMKSNSAQQVGGFALVSFSSQLNMLKSEIANNSAHEVEGTTILGGQVSIVESRVLSVTQHAISACFLVLSSSELSCSKGVPASLTTGFGCLPDAHDQTNPVIFSQPHASPSTSVPENTDSGISPTDAAWGGAFGTVVLYLAYYVYQKCSEQPTKKQRR